MKTSALSKVKFLNLKRRLNLTHWQAVGVLESLWLFTQINAPAGDIGKYTDEEIAAGIEWSGDATELITALVGCRWLDGCPENRLLIHGWEEHAPTYLKGAISRHHGQFAKHGAKHGAKQSSQQAAKHHAKQVAEATEQAASLPNLTIPNQTIDSPPTAGDTSRKKKKSSREYPRNPIFDAIAEVTGVDPSVKSVGSLLGAKSLELSNAVPPYSPEEVREFGRRFHEFCPHAARENRQRPTVPELVKWIGLLRAAPVNGQHDRGFQAPVFLPNAPPMFGLEPEGGA